MFKVKSLAIMARSHCGPRLTACAVHPLRPRDLHTRINTDLLQTRYRLAADWPRSSDGAFCYVIFLHLQGLRGWR